MSTESRFYDERYYLASYCEKERQCILEMKKYWEGRREIDKETYSSLISDYNSYIKLCKKLVDDIVLTEDELIKINTIRFLIMKGIFSHTNKFKRKRGIENIVYTKSGINVIDGVGACRHISEFITDIMPKTSVLTCLYQQKEQFDEEANLAINLIYYNGIPYGFDGNNNGTLYKFTGSLSLSTLNYSQDMYYKPYVEIILYDKIFEEIEEFLKSNKIENIKDVKTITHLKELLLKYKAYMNISRSSELISDFKSDTRIQVEDIKEQIKEIKRVKK